MAIERRSVCSMPFSFGIIEGGYSHPPGSVFPPPPKPVKLSKAQEKALAARWECPRCGWMVLPGERGHRCTESPEPYTTKPGVE